MVEGFRAEGSRLKANLIRASFFFQTAVAPSTAKEAMEATAMMGTMATPAMARCARHLCSLWPSRRLSQVLCDPNQRYGTMDTAQSQPGQHLCIGPEA